MRISDSPVAGLGSEGGVADATPCVSGDVRGLGDFDGDSISSSRSGRLQDNRILQWDGGSSPGEAHSPVGQVLSSGVKAEAAIPDDTEPATNLTGLSQPDQSLPDLIASSENSQFPSFCYLPGNPSSIYCIGMAFAVLFFVVIPVVCTLSLFPTYEFKSSKLSGPVASYISAGRSLLALDWVEGMMYLFTYIGDSLNNLEYTPTSVKGYNKTILSEDGLAIDMPSLAVMQVMKLVEQVMYSTTMVTEVPHISVADAERVGDALEVIRSGKAARAINTHIVSVIKQQNIREKAIRLHGIRDVLANTIYNESAIVSFSRVPSLLHVAKMACYTLTACLDAGGADILQEIEHKAGLVAASSSIVVNDIFSLIESTWVNITSLPELVTMFVEKDKKRRAVLDEVTKYLADLKTLMEPYMSSSKLGRASAVLPLAFVLPAKWGDNLYSACEGAFHIATELNTAYNDHSPEMQWLGPNGGALIELNEGQSDILFSGLQLGSFFSHHMGEGLAMELPNEEIEAISKAYEAVPFRQHLRNLRAAVQTMHYIHYVQLVRLINDHTDDGTLATSFWMTAILVICSLLALVSYGYIVCGLRYRLRASAYSFGRLFASLVTMLVLQVGISVALVQVTTSVPQMETNFTKAFLNDAFFDADIERNASSIGLTALRLSLLVASNDTSARAELDECMSQYTRLREMITSDSPELWVTSLDGVIASVNNLMKGGFFPFRQQMSAFSSLRMTQVALSENLHLPDLWASGNATKGNTTLEPCQGAVASAALGLLTHNFLALGAVSQLLVFQQPEIRVGLIQGVTQAAVRGSCATAAMMTDSAGGADCQVPSVCSDPSSFGMLRHLSGPSGLYQMFSPGNLDSRMGALFKMWNETFVYLSGSASATLDSMEDALHKDSQNVAAFRRLVVLTGMFTCIGLTVATLLQWRLLFGRSFFSSPVM